MPAKNTATTETTVENKVAELNATAEAEGAEVEAEQSSIAKDAVVAVAPAAPAAPAAEKKVEEKKKAEPLPTAEILTKVAVEIGKAKVLHMPDGRVLSLTYSADLSKVEKAEECDLLSFKRYFHDAVPDVIKLVASVGAGIGAKVLYDRATAPRA